MTTLKWFRFIIAKIYNILRYVIVHILRHMCNLHIKETEISRKRSNGIKNWKITYSVILSVLSNKTNLILGWSSPLIGLISCLGECDLMVQLQKYSVIFSQVQFVTFICIYNTHQDTKSARLIAVCKRTVTARCHVHFRRLSTVKALCPKYKVGGLFVWPGL